MGKQLKSVMAKVSTTAAFKASLNRTPKNSGGSVSVPIAEDETTEALLTERGLNGGIPESKTICSLDENPNYVLRVCASGQLKVLENLISNDKRLLQRRDDKGWTCLHHAAAKNRIEVIDYLIEKNEDPDVVDLNGDTPLHIAVRKGHIEAVDRLLKFGADGDVKNKSLLAPIHVATLENRCDVIQTLAKYKDKLDANVTCERGMTALHLAATHNYADCAKALIDMGCLLCRVSEVGLFPIHCAAKNASYSVIDIFLQTGEKHGYTRAQMLGFTDSEMNSPLHAAVNSGDQQVVKTCIDYGAEIDLKQTDNSTAFHLACSQGSIDMVTYMYEKHLEKKGPEGRLLLEMRDVLNMTPLHRAALFDHPEVVEFLIKMGADVDARDCESRTPMLIAAQRGASKVLRLLIDHCDVTLKDQSQQNVLHLVVLCNCDVSLVEQVQFICQKDITNSLLNQKDFEGCTPLHLASKEGNLKFIEVLIDLGANLSMKNNEDQSPLHFAAKYGRINTVRKLLASSNGPNIINETDGDGMTPLHIASRHGHTKVVQHLLYKGALLHKDYSGKSPLHLAAENGYDDTVQLLISVHQNLLNQKDKAGNTPLHLASMHNHPAVVTTLLNAGCANDQNNNGKTAVELAITARNVDVGLAFVKSDRCSEIMSLCSDEFLCPTLGLIEFMPEVYKALLDRCWVKGDMDKKLESYWEEFDFQYMQATPAIVRKARKAGEKRMTPLLALNKMVENGRVELLSHPLCLTYLDLKWKRYGSQFYFFGMIFYMFFVMTLTLLITSMDPLEHICRTREDLTNCNVTENEANFNHFGYLRESGRRPVECFAMVFLLIFAVFNIIKEFIQMYQQHYQYFVDFTNYQEWTLYITILVFVCPPALWTSNFTHSQWQCGIIATFFAWYNVLLYLQRLDSAGIYVVMFLQILRTLVKVIMVFSVLIIAYGLAFYMLLSHDNANGWHSPLISILHTIMLMMGDSDFLNNYVRPLQDENTRTLHFPGLSFWILITFMIFVPILFINLLIGLAVGDIEMVQKDAQLKRLAMQVEYHTELELKLAQWLLEKVDINTKEKYIVHPNAPCGNNIISKIIKQLKAVSGGNFDTRQSELLQGNKDCNFEMLATIFRKQNDKITEIQTQLDKQYELIRLIVQKMEIKNETDNFDEGCYRTPIGTNCPPAGCKPNKSPALKAFSPSRVRAKMVPIVEVLKQRKKQDSKHC